MSQTMNRVLVGGLVGLLGWRAIGPHGRKNLLQALVEISAGLEQNRLAQAQAQGQLVEQPAQAGYQTPFQFEALASINNQSFATANIIDLPVPKLQSLVDPSPLTDDSDGKWRDVIVHPSVVLIVGKRGSGKSALAYRLLEVFKHQLTPYIVGAPSASRKLLPEWVGFAPTLEELPRKTIALIDEAYLQFHSRRSMAEASTAMSQILNLSRQREQTLVFVSQEARQIDKNVSSSANVIVFKDLGALQLEFDRREFRKLAEQSTQAMSLVEGDKRKWSYVYSPDTDCVGLLNSDLPSFWKPSLSKVFASEDIPATFRAGERTSIEERVKRAIDLRSQGHSYAEIAKVLGVSKSTVVNYLKDYPYKQ